MMPLMLIMMKQATEQKEQKKEQPKKESKTRRASSAYPKINHKNTEDDSKPLISDDAVSRISCEEGALQMEKYEKQQESSTRERYARGNLISATNEVTDNPTLDHTKERNNKINVTIPCILGSTVCSYIVRKADHRCTMYLSKEGKKVPLLTSRRKATSSHILITDPVQDTISKSATLKYNIFNTNFSLYENYPCRSRTSSRNRLIATIVWHKNILHLRSQRRISVIVPYSSWWDCQQEFHKDSDWPNRRLDCDSESTFVLRNPFTDLRKERNTREKGFRISEKNFTLVEEKNEEEVVLNFERIGKDLFCLDYSYPLSAQQAFGIALSSLFSR